MFTITREDLLEWPGISELLISGEQQAEVRGEKKGERKGEINLLTKQLEARFGALPTWATKQLATADLRKLEQYPQNHPYAYSYSGGLNRTNQGMMDFAQMCATGRGGKVDRGRAIEFWIAAARANLPQAQGKLDNELSFLERFEYVYWPETMQKFWPKLARWLALVRHLLA